MKIGGIDHLVLTVKDIERSVSFYTGVLGMEKRVSSSGRSPAGASSFRENRFIPLPAHRRRFV